MFFDRSMYVIYAELNALLVSNLDLGWQWEMSGLSPSARRGCADPIPRSSFSSALP